jgi:hypothetical protein
MTNVMAGAVVSDNAHGGKNKQVNYSKSRLAHRNFLLAVVNKNTYCLQGIQAGYTVLQDVPKF